LLIKSKLLMRLGPSHDHNESQLKKK